jgi:hypothetical protein
MMGRVEKAASFQVLITSLHNTFGALSVSALKPEEMWQHFLLLDQLYM